MGERIRNTGERPVADETSGAPDPHREAAPEPSGLQVPVDAAMCAACAAEVLDPYARRYRYPLATCGACGPRYSITQQLPFARSRTSMARYPMCDACAAEDARAPDGGAVARACFACGPGARLERVDGRAFSVERYSMLDAIDAVASLLLQGEIVAVKGLGGYHVCCDATDVEAVERLRARSGLRAPLPLMANDVAMIERYARVDEQERAQLDTSAAPIVMLERCAPPAADEAEVDQRPDSGPPTRPIRPRGRDAPYRPLARASLWGCAASASCGRIRRCTC